MNSEIKNTPLATSDELSLKDIILKMRDWCFYLLSKWLLITLAGLVFGALGFTYAYLKQPLYTATTTFVLEEGGSGAGALGNLGGLASMAGIDIGGGGGIFQGDNILELYKSRSMIEQTLLTEVVYNGKKELLIDRYIDFNKLRENWDSKPELKAIQFKAFHDQNGKRSRLSSDRLKDSILGVIANDVSKNYLNVSKPEKKLSIIKADVRSSDEFFAKSFNDQIVKNVNDFYIQTKTKKSLDNVAILQQKTDSVRAVMNGAIYTAAAVTDATPNLNPTRQSQRVAPVQRSQFNAETNKSILSELVKNLELSKISLRKETPLIQVIDQPVFPLDKVKLGKAKGLIIGGILGGFIACLVLIVRRLLKMILD